MLCCICIIGIIGIMIGIIGIMKSRTIFFHVSLNITKKLEFFYPKSKKMFAPQKR